MHPVMRWTARDVTRIVDFCRDVTVVSADIPFPFPIKLPMTVSVNTERPRTERVWGYRGSGHDRLHSWGIGQQWVYVGGPHREGEFRRNLTLLFPMLWGAHWWVNHFAFTPPVTSEDVEETIRGVFRAIRIARNTGDAESTLGLIASDEASVFPVTAVGDDGFLLDTAEGLQAYMSSGDIMNPDLKAAQDWIEIT